MKTKTVRPPSTKSIQRLVSALQKKGVPVVTGDKMPTRKVK